MRKLLLFLLLLCSPAWATFTHLQGKSAGVNNNPGPVTSFSLTLGAAPTTGNLVTVGIFFADFADNASATISSVKDSNNNSYTVSANSPTTYNSNFGMMWGAYLLSAPSNATATITVTFTGSVGPGGQIYSLLFADEWTPSGTVSFDNDNKVSSGTSGAAGAITTPTVAVAGSGELLYSVVAADSGFGTVNSPYTHCSDLTSAFAGFIWGEYNASGGSGSPGVNYTDVTGTSGDPYGSIIMAFSLSAAAPSLKRVGPSKIVGPVTVQ